MALQAAIAVKPGEEPKYRELSEAEEAQILAEWKANEERRQANLYKHQRLAEYGDWREQLDMLYWDKMNGTDKWHTHITEVKAKYPKPSDVR